MLILEKNENSMEIMLIQEQNEISFDIGVNTIFYVGDKKIKVVKSTNCDDCDCCDGCDNCCAGYDCDDCFFYNIDCSNFLCYKEHRKDNTDVKFIRSVN